MAKRPVRRLKARALLLASGTLVTGCFGFTTNSPYPHDLAGEDFATSDSGNPVFDMSVAPDLVGMVEGNFVDMNRSDLSVDDGSDDDGGADR